MASKILQLIELCLFSAPNMPVSLGSAFLLYPLKIDVNLPSQ